MIWCDTLADPQSVDEVSADLTFCGKDTLGMEKQTYRSAGPGAAEQAAVGVPGLRQRPAYRLTRCQCLCLNPGFG